MHRSPWKLDAGSGVPQPREMLRGRRQGVARKNTSREAGMLPGFAGNRGETVRHSAQQ